MQAGIDHHHKLAMATSNNGSSSFGGSTSRANSPACHIKCFLCDVPCGPWGIIYDFCEPVCRACCNYEGIERISEVINEARRMRHSLEQYPRQQKPPLSSSLPHQHILTGSMGTNELTAFSSSVCGCSGMAAPVVPVAHFSTAPATISPLTQGSRALPFQWLTLRASAPLAFSRSSHLLPHGLFRHSCKSQ